MFPPRCGNGIKKFTPKNSPKTVPAALRERPRPSKKIFPKPFPPRCGNGINFSKDSPQKIPKKPFPLRCGN
jgi:hypothetical protein